MYQILHFDSLTSTNDQLMKLIAQEKAEHGTVVVCNEQTGGKGQGSNTWISEAGKNLTFSILIDATTMHSEKLFLLNKCIALSVVDFLKNIEPSLYFTIKWPNDILFENKKIAGILIENIFHSGKIDCIAGIGININQQIFPKMTNTPVSLSNITGKSYNNEQLLQTAVKTIITNLKKISETKNNSINDAYDQLLFQKDALCFYQVHGKLLKGRIKGVDASGKVIFRPQWHRNDMLIEHGDLKWKIE